MRIARQKSKRKREADEIDLDDTKQRVDERYAAERFSASNGSATKKINDAELTAPFHVVTSHSGAATPDVKTWSEPKLDLSDIVLTKPSSEMRGHTSYLTFASMYPTSIREKLATQSDPTGGPRMRSRAPSEDTEYGSEGLGEALGTMTEEEMVALTG